MDDVEIRAQVFRLKAAAEKKAIRSLIPRVVAAGFGVLPLGEGEGWLELAASPTLTARAAQSLARLLKKELRLRPMREEVIQGTFNRFFPHQSDGINFHTFTRPDFLEDPDSSRLLLEEKPFEPVKPTLAADPSALTLLDYGYKSWLWNLDAGPPKRPLQGFEAGSTELPFVIEERAGAPAATLARTEPLAPGVFILAREAYSTSGVEHAHGWRSHELDALPFMIHPTEIQIVGVHADGALDLLIYDDVATVRPGETPRFDVHYQFLSMGQRIERHLILKVYGLHRVARADLRYRDGELPWSDGDLGRWLGQDLALPAGARTAVEAR